MMKPEPYDQMMDDRATEEYMIEAAISLPISEMYLEWLGTEELEIAKQLAPRLNFLIPSHLMPFIGAIYKLAYAEGMEQAKQTVEIWYKPKPW